VELQRERPPYGSAELGMGRSPGSSVHKSFRLGDCQVGPKVGLGLFAVFLAHFYGEVGPWICVLALDWSKVCLFGSMRCHRHVGACVAARRHVACRVILSCAYLFHSSSEVYKWCIRFNHLDETVTTVHSKLAFGAVIGDNACKA
jgi:hypothetical protein